MKKIVACLAVAGLALSPVAALAQDMGAVNPDQSFAGVDTDRNGGVSWTEFSLVFTDYTEEQFNAADLDGNGELSLEEFDGLVLATGSISSDVEIDRTTPESLTETTTE